MSQQFDVLFIRRTVCTARVDAGSAGEARRKFRERSGYVIAEDDETDYRTAEILEVTAVRKVGKPAKV
jgi:hypothetical protein